MAAHQPLSQRQPRSDTSSPSTGTAQRSLRTGIDELKRHGERMSMPQAVGILVPITVQLAELHESGARLIVYPSCLIENADGYYQLAPELAQRPPRVPLDWASVPPECRNGALGDARASVYSLGAMLYEMVTGEPVQPGMRSPTQLVPDLPADIEFVLSQALIVEASHRPADLRALAQAIQALAPTASVPPPANLTAFSRESMFSIEISLSMLPPVPAAAWAARAAGARAHLVPNLPAGAAGARAAGVASRPHGSAPRAASGPLSSRPVSGPVSSRLGPGSNPTSSPLGSAPQSAPNSTAVLTALKTQLEADPAPRYVAIKDGMDHGPFSAIELLQQIANHGFSEDDQIRDNQSGEARKVRDWPHFAPFADHARRHRDVRDEKAALERVVAHESRTTRSKAFLGVIIVGVLLLVSGGWYISAHGTRSDAVAVQEDTSTSIESDGQVAGGKRAGARGQGGARILGKSGKFPLLAGGMSCEAAYKDYSYEMSMGQSGPADLTSGHYAAVLNSGSYFSHCGVPNSMGVNICAAVQNGRAVGVTVTTKPANGRVQGCIASAVRRLSFPSHPRLDVTRTTFAPQ